MFMFISVQVYEGKRHEPRKSEPAHPLSRLFLAAAAHNQRTGTCLARFFWIAKEFFREPPPPSCPAVPALRFSRLRRYRRSDSRLLWAIMFSGRAVSARTDTASCAERQLATPIATTQQRHARPRGPTGAFLSDELFFSFLFLAFFSAPTDARV